MPEATVRYTEQARVDLRQIFEQRLAQRGADGWDGARALIAEILATIDGLADYPERGPQVPELVDLGDKRWRQVLHAPYRVVYHLEGDVVTVALVADGRRDFSTLLQRRLLALRR
jgi:plasmid stabilization system protein ParE